MNGTNSEIYDKRLTSAYPWQPFTSVPYSTSFYYVVLDENKRPRVIHYFYVDGPPENPEQWQPIPPDRVAGIVAGLAANARAGGSNPPISGSNFQDVVWSRKSWVVILVDEDGWALRRRIDGGAVVFDTSKGSTPNHSFFDGRDLEIEVQSGGGEPERRSAVAFINHMKRNSDGDDLSDEEAQHFEFEIYLDVRYSGGAETLTVILDPGGDNLGPPVPPP